ncbi:hypothetical protein [Nocardia sp. NPDC003963]
MTDTKQCCGRPMTAVPASPAERAIGLTDMQVCAVCGDAEPLHAPDLAVLLPDGDFRVAALADIRPLCPEGITDNGILRELIGCESMGTMGVRRLRAWFDDNFASGDAPPNRLADVVLAGLGYRQDPGFWRGIVVLTMEEDSAGATPPLPDDVVTVLQDLALKGAG